MTTLLIARHGNTFQASETPRRVGITDLPLVNSGKLQAQKLGCYLQRYNIAAVYSSALQRAQQTAAIAIEHMQSNLQHKVDKRLNEINYGVDENQPEEIVKARIGELALRDWEQQAIVPDGWLVDANELIANWQAIAADLQAKYPGQCVLIVTSNGVARFAGYLTGDFKKFCEQYKPKMATGSLSSLSYRAGSGDWEVEFWNYAM